MFLIENILEKYSEKINGVFSFFDRMIFIGHIRSFFNARPYFLSAENVLCVGKSICNLYRYAEVAKASNHRYFCSLQNVIPVKSARKEIRQVCARKTENGKAYTGFNVWEKETMRMFRIISDGKYLLTGFTNKAVCRQIYPQSFCDKRNRGRIRRLLKKLRVHGLIRKVPHSHR